MKLSWKEWMLILAAIVLMAFLHRLDLLVIVAPLSVLVSYGILRVKVGSHSGQR